MLGEAEGKEDDIGDGAQNGAEDREQRRSITNNMTGLPL